MTTDPAARVRLESALCTEDARDRVEMVLSSPSPGRYRVANADGAVEFERHADAGTWRYVVHSVSGRNPLGSQQLSPLGGLDAERADRFPDPRSNTYPYAYDSVAQLFDSRHAPDLVICHTAAHSVGDQLGMHGSPAIVQARAPFIAAGAGIRSDGWLARDRRMIDVAPTLAALLGLDPHPDAVGPTGERREGALLRRQDGDVATELLDGTVAEHVVVVLLDGCNPNLLRDTIDAGDAPHIASILERGTALDHGLMASMPTATLANHTTALTGAHPGHSGVVHHTWWDRDAAARHDLLDLSEMFWSQQHVDHGVETLFEALRRSRPGARSVATFEFCDRGADVSSFAQVRAGAAFELPDTDEVDHMDPDSAARCAMYELMSRVDHSSLTQTLHAWSDDERPPPALTWCSLSVTDEAAHAEGPHSPLARRAVVDSDHRVGDVLHAIRAAGVEDRTAVVVLADHGMEQCDPGCSEPLDGLLAATGVEHLEFDGFVYLT